MNKSINTSITRSSDSAFLIALEHVFNFEGDLADDPHDPGGLTRYGISQRAYPHVDIRQLSRQEASEIYKRDYWDRCRCGQLPHPLNQLVFDAAVNQGVTQAILFLQKALRIKADGVIGAQTLEVAQQHNPQAIAKELLVLRALHYTQLKGFSRYGKGWLRRLFSLAQLIS